MLEIDTVISIGPAGRPILVFTRMSLVTAAKHLGEVGGELLDGAPRAASGPQPAHGRLVSDGDGGVWVQEGYHPRGSVGSSDWFLLQSDDTLIGRIVMPEGFHVLSVRAHEVMVLQRDELGVEFVRA